MKLLIIVLVAFSTIVVADKASLEVGKTQEKRQSSGDELDKQAQGEGALTSTAFKYLSEAQKSSNPQLQAYNLQSLNYNQQPVQYVPQSLAYSPQSSGSPNYRFILAPQQHQPQQQQQIEFLPQALALQQQPKAALPPAPSPALQKLVASQFSPASEVSSFRYTSPLVTYSNQGVLSQIIGKGAVPQVQLQQQSPQPQQSQQLQTTVEAKQPQYISYSGSPQKAASQPPQYSFFDSPQLRYPAQSVASPQRITYSPQPPQQQQYTFLPQSLAYSQPQRLLLSQSGASLPPSGRILIAQGPQTFSGSSPPPQQVVYTSSPPQQSEQAAASQHQYYSYSSPQASSSIAHPVYALPPNYYSPAGSKYGIYAQYYMH